MIILWIALFIATYVAAFFLIRNAYQILHTKGYLHSIECGMDWTWWIPVVNLFTVVFAYMCVGYYMLFIDVHNRQPKPKKRWNNPTWLWLTNQHLKG